MTVASCAILGLVVGLLGWNAWALRKQRQRESRVLDIAFKRWWIG